MKTRDIANFKGKFPQSKLAGLIKRQVKAGGACAALVFRQVPRAASRLVLGLFFLASFLAIADDKPPLNPFLTASPAANLQTVTSPVASTGATYPAADKPAASVPPVLGGRNMDSLDDKQKVGVGDTVSFRVLEDQTNSQALTVTDAGQLDVPELGLVEAKGKTCKQLAIEIKSKLEQVTYYHATVIIGIQLLNKTTSGRRVYVAGQVRLAGPQEIPAGEIWTVSKAILAAGGFTDVADKKSVRLVRAGAKGEPAKTILVNIVDVWEKGRTERDIPVEAEDLIYVPTRAVNFN